MFLRIPLSPTTLFFQVYLSLMEVLTCWDLLLVLLPTVSHSFSRELKRCRISYLSSVTSKIHKWRQPSFAPVLLFPRLPLPYVRALPILSMQQALVAFDDTMRDNLSDLAGGPLSDWSWLKASLPCSLGGLNLRQALLHAPAAYIGSLQQSQSLISGILGHPPVTPVLLHHCISALAVAACKLEWSSLQDIDIPLRQRVLSKVIDEASYDTLLDGAPDTRSRALALSCAIPHAGNWLKMVPSSALGLHLLDCEFHACLQYWLGLRMFGEGVRCSICQVTTDPYGYHNVGCGGNGDRIQCHDSIRDAVFSAAQTAALAPRKEVPSLIPGTLSRPADIFLPNWKRGRPAALDVTVISTLQQLTLRGAACTQGHALLVGEERKMAAHAESCRAVGVSFVPLVIETLGGWSKGAADALTSIGRLLGQRLGIPPSESTSHLFQRCAISLWRGNATLWFRRLPVRPPMVDGIL